VERHRTSTAIKKETRRLEHQLEQAAERKAGQDDPLGTLPGQHPNRDLRDLDLSVALPVFRAMVSG